MKRVSVAATIALVVGAIAAASISAQEPGAAPAIVAVSAKRFEFTPNQITIKRGEAVTIRATTEDREHGLFQKDLKIGLDIVPGKTAEVTITPDKAGRFVAICDHFCGSGHGNMKLVILVE
ncbi:MAG TPA: cupredoxin domain-containing protein [Thermoanaerobaculia bacterium]|nr:cupredoxin domain-containing protein [Thermoanaerobaculia bacterium]